MFDPTPDIILAPNDPTLWPQFRAQLAAWRVKARSELAYSDALYRRPDFSWVESSYACYFLILNDERFYDAAAGRYRVEEWLELLAHDFGGCDSVVLWHAYPRIGLDDRNQYDFYRDQPGGLAGLRAVVDDLHRAGVRVYIDYNPWDQGTRREGRGDVDMLVELVTTLDVDGIFLDTLKQGAVEFRAKLDAARPGTVLEGEVALPLERVADHHMAWAQLFVDSAVPGVVRNKWFERRHQLHHTDRWARDRTAQMQTAFMNGTGTMLWDNIFGTWNGYSEREKSILRPMFSIQRRYAAVFTGEQWTPLVPTKNAAIFASLWETESMRLWTLVNRSENEIQGQTIELELKTGEKLWDLIAGEEVRAENVRMRARGIGAFLAARPEILGVDFPGFLAKQRALAQRDNWSTTFSSEIKTRLEPIRRTSTRARTDLPADMVYIPGGPFHCAVQFRARECGEYESTQPRAINQWGPFHVPSWTEREVVLRPYAMDLTPVTNRQFAEFLTASGHRPKHAMNFLRHWANGAPPAGRADHPVVYVDLDDARAYARWAAKRLPTEEEWQFAAQGTDARPWPWGAQAPESGDDRCNGGDNGRGTTPVKQFPNGRSPFGLYDLCGNTWEWTESERSDGINRFSILRGGSFYKAEGSKWYMDGGPQQVTFANKFMHSWPGLDRCATIGFRCVVDMA